MAKLKKRPEPKKAEKVATDMHEEIAAAGITLSAKQLEVIAKFVKAVNG